MSRFDELRARFDGAVASLVQAEGDPDPEGYSVASTEVRTLDSDVSWPEDEIEDYWRLYETNPLISGPIDRLATEVFEPGYWIEAASADTEDELTEFLENMGIEAGMPKRDFSTVGEQAIVQHEVRGTYTAEKVTDDQGRHIAVNPIKSNTLKIHTKPDTNILIAPDDHRDEAHDLKLDEEGKAAAFVQFDNEDVRFHNRRERRFQRDQMLFWPRNPDIGDVRGTSRLEQVYERARALQAKLRDNDDAIAMKAWPMILFQLGSEDRPWTKDQMNTFMQKYEEGNLGPGMYHGVPGDVELNEFAGETADIEEAVSTDVDMVIAGMPGPRYALGGFEQNVSTTVAAAQERQYRKLVRRLRRELEDLFTPYLVDVAESWDLDTEDIQLHIGRPDGEVAPEDISGSIIRYTSDANDGEDDTRPIQEPTGGSSGEGSVSPGTPTDETSPDPANTGLDAGSTSDAGTEASESMPNAVEPDVDVAHLESTAELADPRLVSTTAEVAGLTEAIESVLVQTRDQALDEIVELFRSGQSPRPREIQGVLNGAYSDAQRGVGLDRVAEDELQSVAEKTVQTLSQTSHDPSIDATFGPTQRQLGASGATELVRDVQDVRDDMVAQVDAIVGSAQTGSLERLRERLRGALEEDTLTDRARLIAHMHAQQLVNTVKLSAYQDHPDVVGIEVTNACGPNTTPLCRDLAGCSGEPARAFFEEEGTLGAQLQSQTSADLFEGFRPLPGVPPWHHGCKSEIVPVTEASA